VDDAHADNGRSSTTPNLTVGRACLRLSGLHVDQLLNRKHLALTRLLAPKWAPCRPTPEQEALGTGWNHVVRGVIVVKTNATSSTTPTTSLLDRRSERQATHTGGPCNVTGPEAPAVDSHAPTKQTRHLPLVSDLSRG
jgi:hypothetical protein